MLWRGLNSPVKALLTSIIMPRRGWGNRSEAGRYWLVAGLLNVKPFTEERNYGETV